MNIMQIPSMEIMASITNKTKTANKRNITKNPYRKKVPYLFR